MNLSIKSPDYRILSGTIQVGNFTGKIISGATIKPSEFFGGTNGIRPQLPLRSLADPSITRNAVGKYRCDRLIPPLRSSGSDLYAEIANTKTRNLLKPLIELLAGIPSVVYGFFGLVVIVPLIQKTLDLPVGETAFAGSVVLAIMRCRPSSR